MGLNLKTSGLRAELAMDDEDRRLLPGARRAVFRDFRTFRVVTTAGGVAGCSGTTWTTGGDYTGKLGRTGSFSASSAEKRPAGSTRECSDTFASTKAPFRRRF
ncbi:hypothetical protein AAVH_42877 [Aphelenchoides avenae]|nr:hypothetical protein AAVH_42877 [Aphelenchus avenae]